MAIIVSRNGKDAKKVERATFAREDYLQQYIYDNPGSIPLYDIKEDVRLLIVAREYPTASGPIDALGIDSDGDIYIIETKLYRNPDKRLVVAQVLDYGASLWSTYADFSDFFSLVEREAQKQFGMGAGDKLRETFQLGEEELTLLYGNLRRNLSEGNYKFVVLMDQLHARLKDLIIYINQNSQFDIYAVELEYYSHEDFEIMIPKLFGAEVKKDKTIASSQRGVPWNEERLFSALASKLDGEQLRAVRRLYDYSQERAIDVTWGTGAQHGMYSPIFPDLGNRCPYSIRSNGSLDVHFDVLVDNVETEAKGKALFQELSRIEDFSISESDRWKIIPIQKWHRHIEEVIAIVDRTLYIHF
jgi:hypothetical protein